MIDELMLDAQEFDEEDEARRSALQGKSCMRQRLNPDQSQTASRNSFQVAKARNFRIIIPH